MKPEWFWRVIVTVLMAAPAVVAVAQNGFDLSNATIPRDEILPGGPPRDGIPAINQPQFIKPSEVNFLRDDDRVLSVKIDNEVRAYSLRILNWHEIVNDQVGDHAIAVTYCPLAGAGMVFDRSVNGRNLSFGVSGLLYQSDLLMYDRETESLWSQIAMKAVSGAQAGAELPWLPAENMTWHAWREAYPDGKVLPTQTRCSGGCDKPGRAGTDHDDVVTPSPFFMRQCHSLNMGTVANRPVIRAHWRSFIPCGE
jgi:Protein of unknown function (DUF3179)